MRFRAESWIWYTFAMAILIARLISRTLLFGSPKGLQYDDWIMGGFVSVSYTVLIVLANVETRAQSNLLPHGLDIKELIVEEVAARQFGSKIVIGIEQMQIVVIWACKACLLILYYRLTRMVASKANLAIRLLAAYVALGFVVMEILYFAVWCRPFSQYWAVPAHSSQCVALTNHRITNAVFNISSDIIMVGIALLLFIRSMLPLKRKLILCCIFSLGFFVILASVLNKYYGFKHPYEATWIVWYTRESSTAILVANLPFTWTILRKIFNLGAFDQDHPPPPTYHSSRTAGGRRTARVHVQHGVSGGSAETHSADRSASNGNISGSRNSMSLIGRVCASKSEKQDCLRDHSQTSDNGLLNEPIRPISLAPKLHIMDTDSPGPNPRISTDLDIDIERAASPSSSHTIRDFAPHRPLSILPSSLHSRATSPAPSHHRHTPRLSADGTGGFHRTTQLTSPHRAHLANRPRPLHSRSSSQASAPGRPLSPSPSTQSNSTTRTTPTHRSVADGGRSARDRRIRARVSA